MKRLKTSKAMKTTALRKFKQLIDQASTLARQTEEEAPKILLKEYPQAMVDCLLGKINLFQSEITKAQKNKSKSITADVGVKQDQNELDNLIAHVARATNELNIKVKAFKEGVHMDVKKLVS